MYGRMHSCHCSVTGNTDMMPWYLNRLSMMKPREVISRVRTAACLPGDWIRYCLGGSPPTHLGLDAVPQPFPIYRHHSGAAIDRFRIFDLDFPAKFDFEWHRDYRNNKQAARKFGPVINIRDASAVGNIKYIWEINRHQYLSSIAYSGDPEKIVPYIIHSLNNWLEENPYLCGVNWTSSLELGLRVISWLLVYPQIASELARDTDLSHRWVGSLFLHLQRIHQCRSIYSSANNHLIGELVALYAGSVCFPLWPESSSWAMEARESLEREIQKQVSEDGINQEQAMSYHLFTLELLLLAYAIAKNLGEPFSQNYEQRLRAMLHYVDTVATPTGDLPWYGDSDDGRGFMFSTAETALSVITQLGAFLFGDLHLLRFSKGLTAATRALIPNATLASTESRQPCSELFRDGGIAVVETFDGRCKLVMDFGPLGYTSIAAHGHADALSIWLTIENEYFIVDSGTYAYHSDPEWRTFFRGTSAHNTVRIDGKDQSVMAGRFLWTFKASSRLLRFEESGDSVCIDAEHDGYTRLNDPVIHCRSVNINRRTGEIIISDNFQCKKFHEIEIFFHLHEDTCINWIKTGMADIMWRERHIVFSSPDRGLKWEIMHGGEQPILGWRSRSFGQKQPIPTLRIMGSLSGSTTIHTKILIQG